MKRKNIVLCGFMGSGKSTIGNLLSKKMGMAFIDLDAYIEKKENITLKKKKTSLFHRFLPTAVRNISDSLKKMP